MNTLAIDCSTDVLSLCLEKETHRYSLDRREGLRHSENLMPCVDWLFQQAKLEPKQLDLAICSLGPGSFTGLRIAMATAKALARGADCPLKCVPQLDIYGRRYSFFSDFVLPLLDAKKNRFYTALYKKGVRTSDYLDLTREEIHQLLVGKRPLLLTGPDATLFNADELQGDCFIDENSGFTLAPMLLDLGKALYESEGTDPMDIGPMYLRKSEAEIALEKLK